MELKTRIRAGLLVASAACIATIASLEGFSSVPYKDIAGVWTYGFGETSNVKPDIKITRAEGMKILERSVKKHEKGLSCIKDVPLYQHEYDAYVTTAYNIGTTAFCNSSMVKYLKQGKYKEACNAITRWNKARVKGKLVVVNGLVKRREKEKKMCLGETK